MGQSELDTECRVQNIGGITESSVRLPPGVTILAGRNATNRTSFLSAIMAALGSDDVSLKGDAERGVVELEYDGETWTRTISRRDGRLVLDGDPYLDGSDIELAELFAFLLESNDARQAVTRRDDLRDVVMRPIDTEAIEAEIREFESRRAELDDELEELDSLKQRLPTLEERRRNLEQDIEKKEEALAETEAEIDESDANFEETREEQSELDDKLDELNAARTRLESIRTDIESEEESLRALEGEKADLEEELDALPAVDEDRLATIDSEIARLRERRQTVDSRITELQSVIQFNQDVLDGRPGFFSEIGEDDPDGSVTDQLVSDTEHVSCWTCGSTVDTGQIEETVDLLREFRAGQVEQRNDITDDIDELVQERETLKEQQQKAERLRNRLEQVTGEIEDREARIEDRRSQRDELESTVDELEGEVDALRSEDFSDVLDLHQEANRIEFELGQRTDELMEVEVEIEEIEDRLAERERIETERDEVQAEIEDLRTRMGRIERDAVEKFNDHMEEVLELLEYDNLERIWIERTETEISEGRRSVTKGTYDLHVVRSTSSGTVYEDSIDHLSESEREVTGLIFALAGYLAHDAHETVPFMLVDSLEALDPGRIAALIEYFSDYADRLVVALLPDAADAIEIEHHRVTEI